MRLGVARKERLRDGEAGYARDGECPGPAQELPPVDKAVTVLVVEIEYLLLDFLSGHHLAPPVDVKKLPRKPRD